MFSLAELQAQECLPRCPKVLYEMRSACGMSRKGEGITLEVLLEKQIVGVERHGSVTCSHLHSKWRNLTWCTAASRGMLPTESV